MQSENTAKKPVTQKSTKSGAYSQQKIITLVGTAVLAAASAGLMFLDFSVPFMPGFIKMDVSELPALLAGFAYGPVSGVMVCLIKNLFNLIFHSSTGGIGELCNFLLGACFVLPASLIYKKSKNKKGAVLGAAIGAVLMAALSLPINYYISYPVYQKFMPLEAIIEMYQAIFHGVDGLFECLLVFNVPFTLLKGLIDTLLCFLIYKPLSPVLHGKRR